MPNQIFPAIYTLCSTVFGDFLCLVYSLPGGCGKCPDWGITVSYNTTRGVMAYQVTLIPWILKALR